VYLQSWDSLRTATPTSLVDWTGTPEYAFIGHSYTGSRIDVQTLESHLDGVHAALVWGVSAGPDIWYLMLKNRIIAKDSHPKYVFTFFSGNQLTVEPKPATNQRQLGNLLRNRGLYEPEYDAVFRDVDLRYRLTKYVEIVFPTRSLPAKTTNELARAFGYGLVDPLSVPQVLDPTTVGRSIASGEPAFGQFIQREPWIDYINFKEQMSQILTDKVLRTDLPDTGGTESTSAELVVRGGLGTQFLAMGIDLAVKNEIQWVFVRSRLRPNPDGSLRQTLSDEYLENLEKLLTSHGAIFIDLSERTDISDDWFSDDFHTFGHEPEYTEWFYREFKDQFFN